MDAPTAIVIVALVAAIALTAAALLTARSRIGVLSAAAGQEDSSPWAGLSEKAKQSRVFGWILVLLLYLVAVFCLMQGMNAVIVVHHWTQWQAAFGSALSEPAEIALYFRFWIAIAVALLVIALWTQRRLRRRAG